MKKILMSLMMITLAFVVSAGATRAYLSDTETSNGNQFTAGTLDLTMDGNNGTNTVKFTVANMRPGSQNIGTYKLKNVGSVNGVVNLKNIVVTSQENSCIEPETEALDVTCGNPGTGEGELQNLVSLSKLFWDTDCDGWVDSGETAVFDGEVGTIASSYATAMSLNAGQEKCLTAQFSWWSNGASDNLGQGDSFTLDMTAELTQ